MKLKQIVLLNFLILILLSAFITTDNVNADPQNIDNSVIGISYKEDSNLKLAITQKENYSMCYPIVDWYIFGEGIVTYKNGDYIETFTIAGLSIYSMSYESDSKNDITITINDKIFNFKISVVKNTNFVLTEKYDMITIGTLELDSRDLKNIVAGSLIIFVGFIIALRFAKKSSQNQDVEL